MAAQLTAPKHVFVVNDTVEIIELFRDILQGLGHRVSTTTYAPDDVVEVKKADPDLVILDLVIDGEKAGWQLAQKLRMTRATQHIPIIVCTAATEDVREQEGWLVANRITVVLKPFTVDDLERAVSNVLALPNTAGAPRDGDSPRSQPDHSH